MRLLRRASALVPALLVAVASGCGGPAGVAVPPPAPVAVAVPAPVAPARIREAVTLDATEAVVVSASAIASRIGAEILAAGGNAVDAAVATGFALAVTYPTAGNVGGGGFLVLRLPDGRTTAFDFREKAPQAAHPLMFVDATGEYSPELHHRSHVAVGVPGTVAGFALAHARYGRLPWPQLVEPAVRLARDGFEVPPGLARSLAGVLGAMAPYPASVAAFSKDGVPYEPGEVWRQPDLARTLERIRDHGRDGFYRGETARLLVDEMQRGGGLLTFDDLARYEAVERSPVRGVYRGYEIISMPPPSSGGVALIQMLNILEGFDLRGLGHNTAPYLHHLAESMRRAYRDRARYLADPDFVEVPVARLTSKAYAAELRRTIDPDAATRSAPADIAEAPESDETTHYSIVDASGMAVAVTYTLEAGYGSKITVPGAGFLLNNEMGDFNPRPGLTTDAGLIGTEPNLARPGQRMLSSMTPTIVARDGRLVAVVGTPGGRTIINTVLQVLLNVIDHEMDIADAVRAGRMHHQWLPDRIHIEQGAVADAVLAELEARGHVVRLVGRQGTAHSVRVDRQTGVRRGAADARDADAGAAGW
jgi:gamma-glutamyltranspeptidase/glutathione hydrolase